jgi:inactivated superfamily I helicase
MPRLALSIIVIACIAGGSAPVGVAQEPTEFKGEAILKHPIGALAIKAAELMTAGRIEETVALRTPGEQADWKKTPASERKELGDRMKQRAPSPAAFAEAIRKNGTLKISAKEAELRASSAAGDIVAYFQLESGQWRSALGPMVVPGGPTSPGNETRVQGADILKHPIGDLALRHADLIHAGKMDEYMRLASAGAQAKWTALPASERKESLAYMRQHVPPRAALLAAIQSGGVLIIEGDSRATLNLITTEQRSTAPGVASSTSSTVAIPFVMENGQWKIAN